MEPTSLTELTADSDGESLDALLARAEGVIAGLQGEFASGTEERLDRLAELFCRGWVACTTREAAVWEMRRIAHDLKGEAGTFGFELITEIAELFGAYLRETPAPHQRRAVVAGYIDAMNLVWDEQIEGDCAAAAPILLDRMIRRMALI
jgi:chemotaxis protein histidine kinase CheA